MRLNVLVVLLLSRASVAESLNLITPAVVNGTDAAIEAFPFMVSLRLKGSHLCGGTMLNELWVLTVRAPDWTPEQSFPPKSSDVKLCSNIEARICNFAFKASHCLAASSTASDFSVQYASAVISDTSSHVMTAERTIKHEKYSPSKQYVNDIGLVKLKAPLNITLKGFRVKLPVLGSFYETGTPAMLSGWGSGSTEGALMRTLQQVELQVYSSTDCARLHEKQIHPTNICGGVPGGYKSQCLGDSGGPLLVNDVQVGIVSWSVKPCGVPPYPGVFTAVSHYIDWIGSHTGIDFRLDMFVRSREEPLSEVIAN